MKPVAVIAQIQRHITTLSPDRLAEAEPYSSLAKINIQLPTTVADITDLFGQVSTNAGKLSLIGPRFGLRQLASAAIQ